MTCLNPFNFFLKIFLLFFPKLLNFGHLLLHLDLSQLLITRTLGVSGSSHPIPMIKFPHYSVHLLLVHYNTIYCTFSYNYLYNLINNQHQLQKHSQWKPIYSAFY